MEPNAKPQGLALPTLPLWGLAVGLLVLGAGLQLGNSRLGGISEVT